MKSTFTEVFIPHILFIYLYLTQFKPRGTQVKQKQKHKLLYIFYQKTPQNILTFVLAPISLYFWTTFNCNYCWRFGWGLVRLGDERLWNRTEHWLGFSNTWILLLSYDKTDLDGCHILILPDGQLPLQSLVFANL